MSAASSAVAMWPDWMTALLLSLHPSPDYVQAIIIRWLRQQV
jgi:hypothetical protein